MKLRVGLIGFGLAGRYFHAPLIIAAGLELRVITTSRKDEVREIYPQSLVVGSADELTSRSDIDLVVIASPNQFHFSQARDALLAGKHVVVDKPLCVSVTEAQTLASLAQQRNRKLAVFQNRRWDSDFLTLLELQRAGRLGEIASFRARWDRFRPLVTDRWKDHPAPGSGMLYDLGSHLIDQALYLFGRPDWLQADVFTQRASGHTDDGFEILMAKGRLRISLGVSLLASSGDWRYCVHGSSASFFKRGLDPQEDQLRAGSSPTDTGFGVEARDQWGMLVDASSGEGQAIEAAHGRWLSFYEAVRDSIGSDMPEPVTAADAARTLEIIEAAQLSSREGRRIQLN